MYMKFNLLIAVVIIAFVSISVFQYTVTYAVEVYTKYDSPFGIPLDVWISKWWTWWITPSVDQFDERGAPKSSCLINNSEQMVMLIDTTVGSGIHQTCKISSQQGIIINLWSGFFEASKPEYDNYTYEQLSKAAREQVNLGTVTGSVKVDGTPVAKLDEVLSMTGGSLNYKVNLMENVTEVYSKGFNITIPEDTHMPDQTPGTWRSGAHGWFVFLQPLSGGNHTIEYNVNVKNPGQPDTIGDITYNMKVE